MSNVLFNNFTAGLVTPKLAGNYGSSIYHNGCFGLENFSVMLQGGITRRPPLQAGFTPSGTAEGSRIIPFVIDADESYLVELYPSNFKLWQKVSGTWTQVASGVSVYATADDILEVQYAQSADTLYMVDGGHTPQKLHYDTDSSSWVMSDVNACIAVDEDGTSVVYNPDGDVVDADGNLFRSTGEYPRVVGFKSNRLWFASSENNPNRFWASRPFEHENFQFYTMVKTTKTTLSAQDIINLIEGSTTYDDTATYAVGDTVTKDGIIYKCKTAITEPEAWNYEKWEYVSTTDIEPSTTIEWQDSITEDCAIREDACGNDAIRWISAKNNIVLGTASGEYLVPSAVNAINVSLTDMASYGSAKGIQALQANDEIIYVQNGGRKLRSLAYSSNGYTCLDLTYQCDRIFAEHNGVVRMAWRRVPDPTLYVVLGDGTVAVLFYDRGYGLCAWAHWSFNASSTGSALAQVKDVCVVDNETGQDTLFLVKRGESSSVEQLSVLDASESLETSYLDLGTIPYTSEMVTNPYEYNSSSYGSSLGKAKRITAITCRVYQTKAFRAGYGEKYMKSYTGSIGLNDQEVMLLGGYDRFVQMTVRSVGDNPLTLLAFSLELEAER